MSDVVMSAAPRTYPLPQGVIAEAQQGENWQRAYDVPVEFATRWAAGLLSSGGSMTAEMIAIIASMMPPRPGMSNPTDVDFPRPDRVSWAMHGGDSFSRWSSKIIRAVESEHEAQVASALSNVEYSDQEYRYLGLSLDSDPTLVRALVRVDGQLEHEEWSPSDGWSRVTDTGSLSEYSSILLDRELVAAVASALSNSEGLLILTDRPVARLASESAIVAAADATAGALPGTHYYAIVDATDHTAVMNLITISPGPIVRVREGGTWKDDPKVTAQLLSIQPPPLVELQPNVLESVVAQIDGTITQAETNPDYVESIGNESAIEHKKAQDLTDKANEFQARKQMNQAMSASVTQLREERDQRIAEINDQIEKTLFADATARERYDDQMQVLRSSGERVHHEDVDRESRRRQRARQHVIELQDLRASAELEYRRKIIERSTAVTASIKQRIDGVTVLASASQVQAQPFSVADFRAQSQKYWIAGRGAVMMCWGNPA